MPMFEPSGKPRLFGLAPGVDFPAALVDGLRETFKDQPPDAFARVHLIVNTRRMARRIRALLDIGPPGLLPKITLITSFGENVARGDVPAAVSPIRRQLELSVIVRALLEAQPDIAPKSALFDLTLSLVQLMDEMHSEGVVPLDIATINTGDQSGHWERIKVFLDILSPYFETGQSAPDTETRQRMVIERIAQSWRDHPPDHPILIAGSTGSRGATRILMKAIATLPQGAAILPGFDFDQPKEIWDLLMTREGQEDHPQFRYARLLSELNSVPETVTKWPSEPASPAGRTALVSLALRPAPVTDQWLMEAPAFSDKIEGATQDVTLLEAPTARIEALAIAMRLRKAAEEGISAALITPDRTLTRQVTAALARWHILPDDSAGIPLHQSPPGRFLRHIAEMFTRPVDLALLLTILKHPLCHAGASRGDHLRLTRELELFLRREGPPFPEPKLIRKWAHDFDDPKAAKWSDWVIEAILQGRIYGQVVLDKIMAELFEKAERLSRGTGLEASCALWEKEGGTECRQALENLSKTAMDMRVENNSMPVMNAMEFAALLHNQLSAESVRASVTPNPGILIWGTLEARVQGADLLILAGLNEGTWPERPNQDPWVNRDMRKKAGLLLPERRIGLAAHDFQQALCHEQVWLTRSLRSDDAQTVPSRWLNRLCNLMSGIPKGEKALGKMKARGEKWLDRTRAIESVKRTAPASRPSPAPPVSARPRHLSVSQIDVLLRDPYAVYARHVLRLKPLDPLMHVPDHLLRGIVLHDVMEQFVKHTQHSSADITGACLRECAEQVLEQRVPWGEARALWKARLYRAADEIALSERDRRTLAHPAATEETGTLHLPEIGFSLSAKADRIDQTETGEYYLYDYKTGDPPSPKKQKFFQKQLLLETLIAEEAGFGNLPPSRVLGATYLGLTHPLKKQAAPLDEEPVSEIRSNLVSLISAYLQRDTGFTAQRAAESQSWVSPYDHLARRGEWDLTDPTKPEILT